MSAASKRSYRYFVIGILVLAGTWRIVIAAVLPTISRDGVVFCWYARDLGQQGLAYLQTPPAQQHPLFPALILGVQRTALAFGAADSPLTWQRSGQVICWLAGMAVVGLAGALAGRLVRRLELPLDERTTVAGAMLLAALLDLNVWLSSDVMSDQVHLAFYLAAVWLLLKLDSLPAALGCGLFAGLAFLTRQEGFLPVLAGLFVLIKLRRQIARRKLAARAAVLLLGFLICAGPYWSVVGRFSTKKDPRDWATPATLSPRINVDEAEATTCSIVNRQPSIVNPQPSIVNPQPSIVNPRISVDRAQAATLARLETFDLPWYKLLPHALYKLLRGGRVVVPLLALIPLINLRKRLLAPPLLGVTTCAAGHFALTLILLDRHGYLSTRHMLVIVMLLVPFAAMLLGRVLLLTRQRGRSWLGSLILAVCLLPLVAYALRTPNAKDRFLVSATRWLVAHDPDVASQRLLGGGSTRRIAFYADMRWERWPENTEEYEALCAQIRGCVPGYFAIELAGEETEVDQYEREGNRELIDKLLGDEQIAPHLNHVHTQPGPDESELYLFKLQPALTTYLHEFEGCFANIRSQRHLETYVAGRPASPTT
ncbi:MAG: glycosyltransferase family 39 protein [Phycisphaerae bacterium]|nr:glycosyltransferase family 39 protein [Phycisphaerae bacterium]